MSGGWNVRAVGQESADNTAPMINPDADDAPHEALEEYRDEPAEDAPPRAMRRVPLIIVLGLALAWTGFFAWVHQHQMKAYPPPAQWTDWAAAWSLPLVLLGVIWLLVMRNSTREAARFGIVSDALAGQWDTLERRLAVVNRELSLAREFLAAQSRDLDTLGRVAGERLSEHADQLQGLIVHNSAQVDSIATVSARALDNMERLRDDLPVVANSSRDVANLIAHAGTTAQDQIGELVSGFSRLNEFGAASERQVGLVKERVEDALAAMKGQTDDLALLSEQRFIALREQSDQQRAELGAREVEVLAAMRQRAERLAHDLGDMAGTLDNAQAEAAAGWSAQIARLRDELAAASNEVALREEAAIVSAKARLDELRGETAAIDASLAERDQLFFAAMDQRRVAADQQNQAAIDALNIGMAELDAVIAERREDQIAQTQMLTEHSEAVGARLNEMAVIMANIADQGRRVETGLASAAGVLAARLSDSTAALGGTDIAVRDLTEASVRLLELVEGSHRYTTQDIPAALGAIEARVSKVQHTGETLTQELSSAANESDRLNTQIASAGEVTAAIAGDLVALHTQALEVSSAHRGEIDAMRQAIAEAGEETTQLATRAEHTLAAALANLRASVNDALSALEAADSDRVQAIAGRVAEATADAIDRAVQERTVAMIGELDLAAARATNLGREATVQLRDQLTRVNELAGNLESRIARAQERAEEQINHDFSRRMAVITDSLNSNAIDIANALATDVSDTAWSAYLRGDRGIFTRRAMRLIDAGEAREIAQVYDRDPDFRGHVQRYIHDFEAMLRAMLSTRDGHVLGVTLLSSDMGKLYVVLAQAIERLRD